MIGNDDPLVEQLHGQMTHGGVELIGRGHFENGTAATEDTPLDDSLTERPTGTYSASFDQRMSPVRKRISFPSSIKASQTRRIASRGKHVAYIVRNHCIVKTFKSGGS